MLYYHSVKCYSAFKKKEILPFVTTWMDLEDIMLSEINQTQKDKKKKKNLHCVKTTLVEVCVMKQRGPDSPLSRFLNGGPIDILDQTILCGRGACLVHCQMFSSIPGL